MPGAGPLLLGLAPIVPAPPQTARLLVLGSMPGAASLAAGEYYAHPHNAFWPIMAAICAADPALPYSGRRARLQAAGIALWDVLHACHRPGSLDTAIERRSEIANDLPALLRRHPTLRRVLFNGAHAEALWHRHFPQLAAHDCPHLELLRLPSTSPANASWSRAAKLDAWRAACLPALEP